MRSTVSCGAFSARRSSAARRWLPRRLSEPPTFVPRRLSSPCVSIISAWRSWATDMPSPTKARPCRSGPTLSWLISRSVPIWASVSRMPRSIRQRGRCRSPSVCSRAASSRGSRQPTIRNVVKWHSGSTTSCSKRQPVSSTYGETRPPARSSFPVIRTPRSFSAATRPGRAGGPLSSSRATVRAPTLRSGPQECGPNGSLRAESYVRKS
ncbi:hypothetical protein SCYAM73S_04901 [Streptomyces cyaneofuscatus]